MDPIELLVASLASWRAAHLLHTEAGPWNGVGRLRRAFTARHFGVLDCFLCTSAWTALPAAAVISTRRRSFLMLWPALSATAILIERAAFPDTFIEVPVFLEDKETPDVLR